MEEEMIEGEEGGGGNFTISSEVVGQQMLKQIEDSRLKQAFRQAIKAGMKILFSKETHDTVMDQINARDDVTVAEEIGMGVTNLITLMHNQSKGTMPGDIMGGVGLTLMAKVFEYVQDSGIETVTDDDYAEAAQMFATAIRDRFDPEFRPMLGMEPRKQPEQQPQEQGQTQQGLLAQEQVAPQGQQPMPPQGQEMMQ